MMEQLERIWRRVRRLFAAARITSVVDDRSVQFLQIRTSDGTVQDGIPRLGEYGLASRPPVGSDAFVAFLAGHPTDATVIATGHQASRPRSLVDGEVMLYDTRGQRVYLSASGIVVEGTNLPIVVRTTGTATVTATGGVTINGPLTVNGNTAFNGTVSANGIPIGSTHKHTGGTISGLTGTPT